jgi:hypothetical protein
MLGRRLTACCFWPVFGRVPGRRRDEFSGIFIDHEFYAAEMTAIDGAWIRPLVLMRHLRAAGGQVQAMSGAMTARTIVVHHYFFQGKDIEKLELTFAKGRSPI